ncbi:MAG: lipoate--protein ligase family protein [Acidilobaceae archaeon]|nr:lipoate--protein ligase family protein [Acidilobaceae archaeon]
MKLRVVFDGPRDPWLNMAIDEALAIHRPSGRDVLRLYMWSPGAVSIGRKQPVSVVNLGELRRLGLKLVRRPTGGAAVYHAEGAEVTYSVVLGKDHPLHSLDISSSAARIAEAIVLAIAELGAAAELRGHGEPGESAYCYLNPAASDVILMGKKVSGSAQRRERGVLLQHGTLVLSHDPAVPRRLIAGAEEAAVGLWDVFGKVKVSAVMEALAIAMAKVLGYEGVEPSSLTPQELETALELYEQKYSRDSWNLEGKLEAGEVRQEGPKGVR